MSSFFLFNCCISSIPEKSGNDKTSVGPLLLKYSKFRLEISSLETEFRLKEKLLEILKNVSNISIAFLIFTFSSL